MSRCAAVAEAVANDADVGCYDSFVDSSSVHQALCPVDRVSREVVEPRFVAQVTECRANPVVSRRGYLLVTDSTDQSPTVKRWLVSSLSSIVFRSTRILDFRVNGSFTPRLTLVGLELRAKAPKTKFYKFWK